jgi:UDP-N-acetyl-D-mannosaminuronic acid transferase (WecB/TagA/CpsF family)
VAVRAWRQESASGGAPVVAKQQRVLQHRLSVLAVALLHHLCQAARYQLLVLGADEAVVEDAQELVAPQAQQLGGGGEGLGRGAQQALRGRRR